MLFLLPTETVPLICLVAALAQESRTRAGFVRRALGTTWSHICLLGPVAVLLATGSDVANWSDWYIYIAALASFVLLDVAMTMIQMRVVLRQADRAPRLRRRARRRPGVRADGVPRRRRHARASATRS